MNYCTRMDGYEQKIQELLNEKMELEEVLNCVEADYDALSEENHAMRNLLFLISQCAENFSEDYEEFSHLCKTLFGVCSAAAPHMDAHRRRTVRGLLKQANAHSDELSAELREFVGLMDDMKKTGLLDEEIGGEA